MLRSRIDLQAILQQSHPHVDLRLQAFETSKSSFLKAVSSYKNRSIATISERRTNQAAEKKRIAEKVKSIEAETNSCNIREIALVEELEKEKEERNDAQAVVANLTRQLASLNEKCAALDVEMEQYRAIADNLRRERQNEQRTLGNHASHVSPEVEACQTRLACVVEGLKKHKDRILVRFSSIDESDPQREFTFVIDLVNPTFTVPTSSPPLRSLPLLVDELNETKDLYAFIHRMRQEFVKLVAASS
ncbi:chromosome segregation protein Spc25-domain-containing protein [Mycena floridula]|nr:chromosome segregation protein Spc25-domain-containing protein [Mycena floridula]